MKPLLLTASVAVVLSLSLLVPGCSSSGTLGVDGTAEPESLGVTVQAMTCGNNQQFCDSLNACTGLGPCDCPPSLSLWLALHPWVTSRMTWHTQNTSGTAYVVKATDKVSYNNWPSMMKRALATQYLARYDAYCKGLPYTETLANPPTNVFANDPDTAAPATSITPFDAEKLYIAQVAHVLTLELGNFVPWTILQYDSESLDVLLDSTATLVRGVGGTNWYMVNGWYAPFTAAARKDNKGHTIPPPPYAGFQFMKGNGPGATGNLLGPTRYQTIVNLLQWSRESLTHVHGGSSYLNFQETWGYRGHPPVTFVLSGTTRSHPGTPPKFAHWTAGCHGTASFFRDILRTVNIPVQIPRVCNHSQMYFRTEGLYLDHGDNPYSFVDPPTWPVEQLLIDQATYTSWFGTNVYNEVANEALSGPHCANVGRRPTELAPP